MNRQRIVLEIYNAQKNVPFDWNGADCLHFCADVALAITGQDPLAGYRGTYSTEIEARRMMVENGWNGLKDVAEKAFPQIAPSMARAGDWALVANPDGTEVLGVVAGDKVVARTLTGLASYSRLLATAAFKVG